LLREGDLLADASPKPPWPRAPEGERTCPAQGEVTQSPLPPDLPASPTAPAGAVAGAFSVSSTGEALYTMPLLVPPGRAGMEPSLALTYDSSADEGTLGMGFGIAGLSVITRCPKTLARDGMIRAVRDEADDALWYTFTGCNT
jgi:Salmonella virulence plasmid 65kDa B protein